MTPDQNKLGELMTKLLNDMGAAATGALVLIGDKLGLYKALAEAGPLDPAGLAARTGTAERYVREWLAAQASAGYVQYQPETGTYAMTEEQALALADEGSPFFVSGVFEVIASMFKDEPKISEAFRSGRGVGWHEHSPCLFRGTERFFRAGYAAHLVPEWLPALTGVREKLERGARVADVGCGHGASTIVMARAFPHSTITGFDYHGPSIERANAAAPRPASRRIAASRSRIPGAIPAPVMTWWRFSIACTIWGIRLAWLGMCVKRSAPTAPG